ncbi:hypothetical protein HDU83_009719 [Entophlyctis luteolus]|nr:hypothetical protein HDU83_009719 [Entophlyctis luteolus]
MNENRMGARALGTGSPLSGADSGWTRHFDPEYQRHYYAHPLYGSRWDSEHELALAASASMSPNAPVLDAGSTQIYVEDSHLHLQQQQEQFVQQVRSANFSGPHVLEMHASPQPYVAQMETDNGDDDGSLWRKDSTAAAKDIYDYYNDDEEQAYYARLPAGSRRPPASNRSGRSESFRAIGPAQAPGALPATTVFASSGLRHESQQANEFAPGDDAATKSGIYGAANVIAPDTFAQGFKQDPRSYGTNGPYDSKYAMAELDNVDGGVMGVGSGSPRESTPINVSVYSPNYETLATRSIVVSGKLLNGKGGSAVSGVTINGEKDGVSFPGHGTTNFTLPVSLKYSATSVSAITSDGVVTLLESECAERLRDDAV